MEDAQPQFSEWIGKTQRVISDLSPWPARAAAAALDAETREAPESDLLPPLWHWFYFLATEPRSRLGIDGHPERGGFMPPIQLPRRMFAGARITFHRLLVLGRPAERTDRILSVETKTGRSGKLAFVKVGSEFRQEGSLCIEEEQDIVYREAGRPVSAPIPREPPPREPDTWSREIQPDPQLLFRFSALTFNAHRIHYDRPYALAAEGYPGLVVHGPLVAVLLADLVRRNEPRSLSRFEFRGRAPLFDLFPFHLIGRPGAQEVELEARGPDGATALEAKATLT